MICAQHPGLHRHLHSNHIVSNPCQTSTRWVHEHCRKGGSWPNGKSGLTITKSWTGYVDSKLWPHMATDGQSGPQEPFFELEKFMECVAGFGSLRMQQEHFERSHVDCFG